MMKPLETPVLPQAERETEAVRAAGLPAWARAGRVRQESAALLAVTVGVIGAFAVLSTATALWALWTTDPLKSIGGFVPAISLILILRVWQSQGWELKGSWWGLVVVAATVALVHLRDVALIELVISPNWAVFLPPHQVVVLAYAAGLVVLFGGTRLLRRAAFPVALLWFVNPVPNFFTLHIDLPMQRASSLVARGFAHALGQRLTPDQLRLMFTPEFGMFIAPGCNGIRGAITMGLMALLAGYLYRFKLRAWVGVVAGAVLLGYVFNLVRLCALVVYYIVAVHVPWLQSRAEMGDYVLGACLFCVAAVMLFEVIRKLSAEGSLWPPRLARAADARPDAAVPKGYWPRLVALLVVVAVGSVSYARALARHTAAPPDEATLEARFPQQVGAYTLTRQWDESLLNGPTIFHWLEYTAADGDSVSVGVSPVLGAHDTLICHAARGEDWLWHGPLQLATRAGATELSGSLFNDGTNEYLEASTVCSGESCGQYTPEGTHFGIIYSRPDTEVLLGQSPERPIPLLIHAQVKDAAMAPAAARAELTERLRGFLRGVDLADFTRAYREP